MVKTKRRHSKTEAAAFASTNGPAIILVRPQLGENIGTAARAMLNCGLMDLRLVAPRDGWPNVKALNAASGADAVIGQARLFDSVADAVADLNSVFASWSQPGCKKERNFKIFPYVRRRIGRTRLLPNDCYAAEDGEQSP